MSRPEIHKRFFLALAYTLLLFLSGIAIPLVGILLISLVPQPVLTFGIKYGKDYGVRVLFVATLLIFFLRISISKPASQS